jgi:hypothetical protein
MKNPLGIFASFLSVAVLSVGLMAQPAGAARYDSAIQQKVTQELQDKKEFRGVQSPPRRFAKPKTCRAYATSSRSPVRAFPTSS